VKQILPLVELIHSVASDSALRQLERHGTPDTEVLVEVNVAGEDAKAGIAPDELPGFLERARVRVVGLMGMPPFAEDPEQSRPHFRALRELARQHGLRHLSMGTSQDYAVAVEEGATIVRVGSVLFG
jgi:PLP dependent protein